MSGSHADLEENERIKSFLEFVKSASRLKRTTVTDVRSYEWCRKLSSFDDTLPGVSKWTPGSSTPEVLLSVERVEFRKPFPKLPAILEDWVPKGYEGSDWPEKHLQKLGIAAAAKAENRAEKKAPVQQKRRPAVMQEKAKTAAVKAVPAKNESSASRLFRTPSSRMVRFSENPQRLQAWETWRFKRRQWLDEAQNNPSWLKTCPKLPSSLKDWVTGNYALPTWHEDHVDDIPMASELDLDDDGDYLEKAIEKASNIDEDSAGSYVHFFDSPQRIKDWDSWTQERREWLRRQCPAVPEILKGWIPGEYGFASWKEAYLPQRREQTSFVSPEPVQHNEKRGAKALKAEPVSVVAWQASEPPAKHSSEEKPALDDKDDGELFESNAERVSEWDKWIQARREWLEEKKRTAAALKLYHGLWRTAQELSESDMQLMLFAGGIVLKSDEGKNRSHIEHPIYACPATFEISEESGKISVVLDESQPVHMDLDLFAAFPEQTFNMQAVNVCKNSIEEEGPHPFDPGSLESEIEKMARMASPVMKYCRDGEPAQYSDSSRILLVKEPYIWIQKRPAGIAEAMDRMERSIDEGSLNVNQGIKDILLGAKNKASPERTNENSGGTDRIGEDSGLDENIFLTKPANHEQLRIAEQLEHNSCVLVQGPPGTGKTHMIANLIGHYLYKGKRVLVVSQKTPALAVLKDKIDENLRPLCIAMTGTPEENRKTVSDFLLVLGSKSLQDRRSEAARAEGLRKDMFSQLREKKNILFGLLNQETEVFDFQGQSWSLSEIGRWLHQNSDLADVIPYGISDQTKAFSLTGEELSELYQLNAVISHEDRSEVGKGLISRADLLAAEEVKRWLEQKGSLKAELQRLHVSSKLVRHIGESDRYEFNCAGRTLSIPADKAETFGNLHSRIAEACLPPKMKRGLTSRLLVVGMLEDYQSDLWTQCLQTIKTAGDACVEVLRRSIEHPVEFKTNANFDEILTSIKTLRAKESSDGKVNLSSFFNKIIYRKEIAALSLVSVNQQFPSSREDYEAIEKEIAGIRAHEAAVRAWDTLAVKEGAEPYEKLQGGLNDDQIRNRVLPEIEAALGWWKNKIKGLLSSLKALGLREPVLTVDLKQNPEQNCQEIFNFLEKSALPAANWAFAHKQLEDLNARTEKIRQRLKSIKQGSELRRELEDGLEKDSGLYEKGLMRSDRLSAVARQIHRFNELVEKLRDSVPGWAEAFECGEITEKEPPKNVLKSWQWHQIDRFLKDHLSEDASEVQNSITALNDSIRRKTVEATYNRAWAAVQQYENDHPSVFQKLTGWANVVKKIGKGTGKKTFEYQRRARNILKGCRTAIPVWIMPVDMALESFDAKTQFDLVIIDEASQSDVTAFPVLFFGKKCLVVGDDEQVSPMAIGSSAQAYDECVRNYLKGKIFNYEMFTADLSLYDLVKTLGEPIALREHFRCVPDIIGYCNQLSYHGRILPLRDDSQSLLRPAIVPYFVQGMRDNGDRNVKEAEAVVALMKACSERPEYRDKTFGVIVMLSGTNAGGSRGQIALINTLLIKHFDQRFLKKHNVRVGLSAAFQGDERDVIFLSMVDSPSEPGKPLRKQSEGANNAMKKRWNVAVSRAKDQLWAVHSFNPDAELVDGDLRKGFFAYVKTPYSMQLSKEQIEKHADSKFEASVAEQLTRAGYRIRQQYRVGAFRIDMVVFYRDQKIALECDGDEFHSSPDQVASDMSRQAILERLGWRFIRLRGGEYYRDPDAAMKRVFKRLEQAGIFPGGRDPQEPDKPAEDSELKLEICNRAEALIESYQKKEPPEEEEGPATSAVQVAEPLFDNPRTRHESRGFHEVRN
jgi:very-short-patch-repair endonuclease